MIDHQLTASRAEEAGLAETIAAYQARGTFCRPGIELVELTRDYTTCRPDMPIC